MSTKPAISVGVPIYNGASYLANALESLARQDFLEFEVILCDNASTDETADICKKFVERDARFKYFRSVENIGAAPNFNRAFELSGGEYFMWLSHDDECNPALLRRCWEALSDAGPEVTLVYPQCELIDSGGRMIQLSPDHVGTAARTPWRRLAKILGRVCTGHPVYGLMPSSVLRRSGGMRSFISDDYILLGELAMLGEIIEIDEALFRMRVHPGNSRTKCSSLQELAVWFDPRNAGKRLWLPEVLMLIRDHLISVFQIPLSPFDRVACACTVIAVVGYRRARNVLGRVKQSIRRIFNRARIRCEDAARVPLRTETGEEKESGDGEPESE
jgi:glycosyltransferase involved in cell wall biosynthesis